MPTSPPASPAQLILTIAPERDGTCSMWVAFRLADGTASPPRRISIDQDNRLGAFAAAMQEFAGRQLASVKSQAVGRTGDGGPAVADAAHGKQVR